MKKTILFFALLLGTHNALAGGAADPLLAMIKIDQLEYRDSDNEFGWDAYAWLGKDLNKLVVKSEGQRSSDIGFTEAEAQLLYSRAIYPYWDAQIGVRHDERPKPGRDWLALSMTGVAPYFFEIDASMFVDEDGQVAVRLDAEYELLFTQRLVLTPELEINAFVRDDKTSGVDTGLYETVAGLRLRYEIRREFAPYIGIEWRNEKHADGDKVESESNSYAVAGLRIWY